MSHNSIQKFGELAIRNSSLDENDTEYEDITNGFSNIDLNGTQNLNSESGYTSFGLPLNLTDNNQSVNIHAHTNSTAINGNISSNTFSEPNSPLKASIDSTNHKANIQLTSSNTNSSNLSSYIPTSLSTTSASTMLSSASEASTKIAHKTVTTFETLKQWSKSAYKCTRQIVSEKLGKSSRTVDPGLEASIDNLRELKKKYENMLNLANSLTSHFQSVVQTQKQLGETFADLAQKSSELIDEFTINSETQRQLVKHGESLLSGLIMFTSTLKTLCNKTMEDTLLTIRNYEAARLEYDAYRFDLEYLKTMSSNEQKMDEITNLEQDVCSFKQKYENLKKDVAIKIKFLDENRIKVMKKHLVLFQNAINAYFSGNKLALQSSIKQLNNIKENNMQISANPDDGSFKFQSFLEQN